MSAPLDSLVRFGAFELDLLTGELRKAGVRIDLPEQPLQVLKTLLGSSRRARTRELGAEAESVVSRRNIRRFGTRAECRGSPPARCARGRGRHVPRFVETLPRRGYRFIAPVAGPAVAEQASAPTAEIEDRREASRAPDPPPPDTNADSASGARRSEHPRIGPLFSGARPTCSGDQRLRRPIHRPRGSCWPCFPSTT